jgi:hypothetical protein
MSEIDVIKNIAAESLAVSSLSVETDCSLWDRAQRIARNVEHICRFPELVEGNLPVDRFCVQAAAYFSDAGFARYANAKDTNASAVLADLTVAELCQLSTKVVTDKLDGEVADGKIKKINKIIVEATTKNAKSAESRILSDARGLEDVGAVGIFNEFRKIVINGSGVSDALSGWKRKIDYRYWEIRLNESFCFESSAKIAKQRFAVAEKFMGQLAAEHTGRDLEEIVIESVG